MAGYGLEYESFNQPQVGNCENIFRIFCMLVLNVKVNIMMSMCRIFCFYPLRSNLCAIWASNINKTVGEAIN